MRLAQDAVRAEPNVTPMIDVMLVLLVIFMIVLPAIVAGTPATPPVAENLQAHPEDTQDQTLAIGRDGQYYLNKVPVVARALPTALRVAAASRLDDHVLYVRADKELRFDVVQQALDFAGAAGFRVVGLVSEKPR